MDHMRETRWDRKHRLIVEAAAATFLANGYAGTSMDDIAATAAVSKQTVYKHFADKRQLFADVVLATTDQVTMVVQMVSAALEDATNLEQGLSELARSLLTTLMQPDMLRLRRLVITTADQFPDIGTAWYQQGFGRVLAALASRFADLAGRGLLQADDPLLAAHHFVGLLLWIPVNQAMFTGDHTSGKADLESYADAAAKTFLRAYGAALAGRPDPGHRSHGSRPRAAKPAPPRTRQSP
jgi:TetR/AcrR family transcriptional regulator, mexJK operon transcriptional repressor